MKRIYFAIALCALAISSIACDICGCGGGNFYLGMLPKFKHRFFGVRYQYMSSYTQLAADASQFSYNYYNTIELWNGWNIGNKWQLLTFVPYRINKQVDDDGISSNSGLGDISLLANYQLFHTRKVNDKNVAVEQELWIGGGIKLPTGRFKANVNDPATTIADVNAQLGTGSTDFIANVMYDISINSFGVNTTATYKVNTTKNSYQFGDKFIASSLAYYRFRTNGMGISPNLGLMYENTAGNLLQGQKVTATGGYVSSITTGVELSLDKIAIGCTLQTPFDQNYAAGQTQLKMRGTVHVTLAL